MLLFRVEGSEQIGFGHLNRSSYLARTFFRKKAHFLAKEKNALLFLKERKLTVLSFNKLDEVDLNSFRAIVFDLNKFSDEDRLLLEKAKKVGIKTFQITDLGMHQQPVDFIFDSSPEQITPYSDRQKVFLGPQYVLLHHRFRHFNKLSRKYAQKVRRIFISLGGGSGYRQLSDIIQILATKGYLVKVASGFSIKASLRKKLKQKFPQVSFCGKVECLARPLFEADLAIITPGILGYEAACAGTPSFYVWHNEHQEFQATAFQKRGWGEKLFALNRFSQAILFQKIAEIDYLEFVRMGLIGKQDVDGLGAIRVAEKIIEEAGR